MKKQAEITPERLFEAAEAVLKMVTESGGSASSQTVESALAAQFSGDEIAQAAQFLTRMGYITAPTKPTSK
jgi:hypothetical protein